MVGRPAGAGHRQPGDLLAPAAGLAGGGRLGRGAPRPAGPAGERRQDRLGAGLPGQRLGAGEKGGAGTGRNPTDRGKPGVKLHVLSDATGVPLAARVGPANRHDSTAFEAMLDAVPPIRTPAGRRRKRPAKLHADKGYDYARCRLACRQRRIKARIARRGVERSDRLGRHRWVVERTLAWLARYRRLAARHERREDTHQAFLTLACCILCHGRLRERL